ncbi:general substrate transporter [Aspergillus pseudoustus]|uniref:General substrate transporter n=1 Tax=Aspergillus pseudoustus TaxID=1810923 RepID=A0ABR4JTG1_9EURO
MTVYKAIKTYPKACLWSMAVSLVIIMDGYDTALMGSLFGFPAFQQQFGQPVGDGTYQLQAKWQTALGLASPLGNIVGIYINAIVTERWGHKKAVLGSLVFLTGVLFIPFFSKTVEVLFVGQLLCGLAWGVFTTLAPAYASEVAPVALRAYLETFVVLCWGIGQFFSYAAIYSLVHHTDQWAWRIPLAVQWVWPVIIIPLLLFAPESPWWLVRHGRLVEAEQSVKRLSSRSDTNYETQAKQAVALMVETTNLEKALTEGASFVDCFRGSNLWRTEIGCIIWASQALCGFAISNYAAYFYEQAGLSTSNAYKMTIGQGGIHFVCNILSIFITGRYGRRAIALVGYAGMTGAMLLLGFLALAHQTTPLGYGQAVMFLVWYCTYQLTIGPTGYIVVGEISSSRLRSKSISIARNAYNVANIFSATVVPYTLNPTEGNLKGKAGFLAAAFSLICLAWGYFRLPESKGRTYEELDILFSRNLKAREFKHASVDDTDVIELAKTA